MTKIGSSVAVISGGLPVNPILLDLALPVYYNYLLGSLFFKTCVFNFAVLFALNSDYSCFPDNFFLIWKAFILFLNLSYYTVNKQIFVFSASTSRCSISI